MEEVERIRGKEGDEGNKVRMGESERVAMRRNFTEGSREREEMKWRRKSLNIERDKIRGIKGVEVKESFEELRK